MSAKSTTKGTMLGKGLNEKGGRKRNSNQIILWLISEKVSKDP